MVSLPFAFDDEDEKSGSEGRLRSSSGWTRFVEVILLVCMLGAGAAAGCACVGAGAGAGACEGRYERVQSEEKCEQMKDGRRTQVGQGRVVRGRPSPIHRKGKTSGLLPHRTHRPSRFVRLIQHDRLRLRRVAKSSRSSARALLKGQRTTLLPNEWRRSR